MFTIIMIQLHNQYLKNYDQLQSFASSLVKPILFFAIMTIFAQLIGLSVIFIYILFAIQTSIALYYAFAVIISIKLSSIMMKHHRVINKLMLEAEQENKPLQDISEQIIEQCRTTANKLNSYFKYFIFKN